MGVAHRYAVFAFQANRAPLNPNTPADVRSGYSPFLGCVNLRVPKAKECGFRQRRDRLKSELATARPFKK